jgi:hypothetical protein
LNLPYQVRVPLSSADPPGRYFSNAEINFVLNWPACFVENRSPCWQQLLSRGETFAQENWYAKYGLDFSGAMTFNGISTKPYKVQPTKADMHLSYVYSVTAKTIAHMTAYRDGVDYVAKTSAGAGGSVDAIPSTDLGMKRSRQASPKSSPAASPAPAKRLAV